MVRPKFPDKSPKLKLRTPLLTASSNTSACMLTIVHTAVQDHIGDIKFEHLDAATQ